MRSGSRRQGPRHDRGGTTLIELLVALAIMAVLATMAYWGMTGVVPRYRLGTAARDVANALVITRARAIAQNRYYIVQFQGTSYRVIWDRTSTGTINVSPGNDEVVETRPYGQSITYFRPTTSPLPAGDLVAFDPRGLAYNIGFSLTSPNGLHVGLQGPAGSREVQVRYSGLVRKL